MKIIVIEILRIFKTTMNSFFKLSFETDFKLYLPAFIDEINTHNMIAMTDQ